MAYGLDDDPDQVVGRPQQVLEGVPAGPGARPARRVGPHVFDRRLELVETVVQPAQIVLGHNDLPGGDVEGVRPAARLVGALAVGGAAERPRPAGAGPLLQGTVAPAAPRGGTGGSRTGFRHSDDISGGPSRRRSAPAGPAPDTREPVARRRRTSR